MFPYTIRPVQPEKDASNIAGLVQTCFGPWLDLENVEYLKALRQEGDYARVHPLLTRITSFPYKLEGVVCEDSDQKLLGLINAYYFSLRFRACCLVANVCVEPSYRKKGIASEMLKEIERMQISKGIRDIFLQARLANPETLDFYRRRGFRVTDYRETWVRPVLKDAEAKSPEYRFERVPASDMQHFRHLFDLRYPESVRWNLNYRESLFRPGIAADLRNRLESPQNRFCRLTDRSGNVRAWAAYQKLSGFADMLWIVPAEDAGDEEYPKFLAALAAAYKGQRPLKIDVPVGKNASIYEKAGFRHMQTLAWMWKRL